jgi:hypothetical protein
MFEELADEGESLEAADEVSVSGCTGRCGTLWQLSVVSPFHQDYGRVYGERKQLLMACFNAMFLTYN